MGACESSKENKPPSNHSTPRKDSQNPNAKKETHVEESKKQSTKIISEIDHIKINPETLGDNNKVDPFLHYEIINQVAETSLGVFYNVKHIESKLRRFMCEYKIEKNNDGFEHIKKKNQILRNLDHPKILRVYEVYYYKDKYYIVTEYFEKGDLRNFLEKNKNLSEKQVANVIYKVLLSLQYAHQNNIIHGYISPFNILVDDITNDGEYDIKVKEFSYLLSNEPINFNKNLGYLEYYAPEILLNKSIDKSIDLWSVGILTYLLLDGKLPIQGNSDSEIEDHIKNFKMVKFTSENMKKSSSLAKEFIKKLLVFEPEKRIKALDAINDKWFNHYHLGDKNKIVESSKLEHFMSNMTSYGDHFKIQQICIALIVHNLPQNCEIKELEKAFISIDVDMNGKLTKEELMQGFQNIFKNRSNVNIKEEVDKIFLKIDVDNSGTIGYGEFISACIDTKVLLEDKYLKFAFSCFDDNNSGYITASELKSVLTGGGKNEISKKVVQDIMKDADVNNDNKVNYEEFKKMMEKLMN